MWNRFLYKLEFPKLKGIEIKQLALIKPQNPVKTSISKIGLKMSLFSKKLS